jgi:hypothetical protein
MTTLQTNRITILCLILTSLLLGGAFPFGAVRAESDDTGAPIFLPFLVQQEPQPHGAPTDWLGYTNHRRSIGGLPPITETASWSQGCSQHSTYMVKNDIIAHSEDPNRPYYTAEGNAAAGNSNLMVSTNVNTSELAAIDMWLTGPFHGLGILDPRLQSTGFGFYREADGNLEMGACFDVYRGAASTPSASQFPVRWPGAGSEMPYLSYNGGEAPDPLASCSGYSAPSGPPVYLLLGTGALNVNVSASSFSRGAQALQHCVLTENSYTHPNGSYQDLGRWALGYRDAVVVMPRQPLLANSTYTVSITANGQNYTWSFSTSSGLLQHASMDNAAPLVIPLEPASNE